MYVVFYPVWRIITICTICMLKWIAITRLQLRLIIKEKSIGPDPNQYWKRPRSNE